jgi:hypothetical protein
MAEPFTNTTHPRHITMLPWHLSHVVQLVGKKPLMRAVSEHQEEQMRESVPFAPNDHIPSGNGPLSELWIRSYYWARVLQAILTIVIDLGRNS